MMGRARPLGSERVGLPEALNRVLAEDVCSDMDMPPFVKAAMDGYACRREDLAKDLQLVETVKAGEVPQKNVGPGQCTKIMTGGMVPEGADCVIMVEKTETPTEDTVRFTGESTRDNICLKGEDIRTGDVVARKGTRLRPAHIAMLASVGCARPEVARRPRVGIIATGDELVEPEVTPDVSQIRTSNSVQLVAQVQTADALPTYYGIAKDTDESLDATLKKAMAENDVVLLSGGVSMGDFDLVPGIMKANGIDILFDEIAVKPGKPTTFGVAPGCYCVGLPGNPVATFTQFELLVKPFLYKLMGLDFRPPNLLLPLAQAVTRKRAERESWIPVRITAEGKVEACKFHGSAHVEALCQADGLTSIPDGVNALEAGTLVTVRPL